MSNDEARKSSRNPANQPFKGAKRTKLKHWSAIRGHNNVAKREDK